MPPAATPASALAPISVPAPWLNLGAIDGISAGSLMRLERHFRGVYIGSYALRSSLGSWSDSPYPVLYVPYPDLSKGHGHYLGVSLSRDTPGSVILSNAGCIIDTTWNGAVGFDGEVVLSRFRHDFQKTRDGASMVDGGQDYVRGSGMGRKVRLEGESLVRLLWLTPPDPRPWTQGHGYTMEHFCRAEFETVMGSAHERLERKTWIEALMSGTLRA